MSDFVDGTKQRVGGGAFARMAVAAIVAAAAIAGCASGGAPPPPAAPPTPVAPAPTYSAALCSAAVEFQTAANAIVHLNATAVGTQGVKAALQNLQTAGRNLAAAAQDQFGPQLADLNQALASLQTTITGLTDQQSLSDKLGALTAAVSNVEQAAKPIMDSVRTGCPAVPPVEAPRPS
jgi:hypothetical protein